MSVLCSFLVSEQLRTDLAAPGLHRNEAGGHIKCLFYESDAVSSPLDNQMSVLLDLIRELLEYLGIPPDRLVPIWESYTSRHSFLYAITNRLHSYVFQGINLWLPQVLERKDYGCTRSMVRIIGTFLPLEPCPRPHFQPALVTEVLEPRRNETVCRPEIPSLAEAPFLMDDDAVPYTRFRHYRPSPIGGFTLAKPIEKSPSCASMVLNGGISDINHIAPSENAIKKIAALEDELMQLRAQIAAIVAIQDTKSIQSCSETMCLISSPCAALPAPSLTSTPINDRLLHSASATPLTAPPPPPPPPMPIVKVNVAKSAIDLIKERKAAQKQSPKEKEESKNGTVNKFPSMLEVLKGMNSIKLRAVERSPGGTPLTRKEKRRSLNDPAAIIAQALKQKFSHRQSDDSFDKENRSQEGSPFSSPEMPVFGRHLLKPVGKKSRREMTRKQVFSKPGPHV